MKGKVKCGAPGCNRVTSLSSGLCYTHNRRFREHGKIETTRYLDTTLHLRKDAFRDIADYDACYFAGVLYGDGCVRKQKHMVDLGSEDPDMVAHLAIFLGVGTCRVKRVVSPRRKWKVLYNFRIHNRELFEDLRRFNVVPRKSLERTFSYPSGVNDFGYLRGLYDSDGSCYPPRRTVQFYGTESYARAIAGKLSSLGFKNTCRKSSTIYVTSCYGEVAVELAKVLVGSSKVVHNKRKTDRLDALIKGEKL